MRRRHQDHFGNRHTRRIRSSDGRSVGVAGAPGDGERLYVEHDVYHNGQLVHRKYRRTVTEPVARALLALIEHTQT